MQRMNECTLGKTVFSSEIRDTNEKDEFYVIKSGTNH